MARARLSDADLLTHEEMIALMVGIQEDVRALSLDLDVNTLTYVHRRLSRIIERAGTAKALMIAKMQDEKAAAGEARR